MAIAYSQDLVIVLLESHNSAHSAVEYWKLTHTISLYWPSVGSGVMVHLLGIL